MLREEIREQELAPVESGKSGQQCRGGNGSKEKRWILCLKVLSQHIPLALCLAGFAM